MRQLVANQFPITGRFVPILGWHDVCVVCGFKKRRLSRQGMDNGGMRMQSENVFKTRVVRAYQNHEVARKQEQWEKTV